MSKYKMGKGGDHNIWWGETLPLGGARNRAEKGVNPRTDCRVPPGCDAVDRSLVIKEAEAETVRTVFRLYPQQGNVADRSR